jgi:hypothetical protein
LHRIPAEGEAAPITVDADGGEGGAMTILGFKFGRRKSEEAIDPAMEAALRVRLDARLKMVDKARRSDGAATMRDDARKNRREPVYRIASAMFEIGDEASCRVIDQSYSGLRLAFHEAADCPDEFALSIPTLRFIGIVRKAWQNDNEVGVSILRWSDAA